VATLSLASGMSHAADSVTCTCPHTGAAECPMHHSTPKKHGCECRSTTDPDAGAVLSMLGPIAVLADALPRAPEPAITRLPNYPITQFTDAVLSPTSPPPRA
jgi:hypothetical protein